MKSSLQRNEQGRESSGFPLRPFVLSLVLHLALLAGWLPQFIEAARQNPPAAVLHGVLLPASPQREPVVPLAVPATPVFAPAGHRPSLPRRPTHAQTPAFPADAVPAAGHFIPSAPTFEPPAASLSAGGVPASREADVKTNVALTTTATEPGPDQAGLRQFRLSLAGEARRFRRYPESARQAGLAGTSEVRVAVEAGGMARRADLARSSGHEILDKAALDMLRQAASRAVLPESLRGQSFVVLLPVVFEVEE